MIYSPDKLNQFYLGELKKQISNSFVLNNKFPVLLNTIKNKLVQSFEARKLAIDLFAGIEDVLKDENLILEDSRSLKRFLRNLKSIDSAYHLVEKAGKASESLHDWLSLDPSNIRVFEAGDQEVLKTKMKLFPSEVLDFVNTFVFEIEAINAILGND